MVAMKAATDAAQDMIKALTREYNRARQTQITMELPGHRGRRQRAVLTAEALQENWKALWKRPRTPTTAK